MTPNDGYCWSDGTTAQKDVSWSIAKADAPTITVTGYSGMYDGSAHDAIESVTGQAAGSTVEYSLDGTSGWTTTVPKVTNVSDSKTVYVRATNSNYETATGSAQATVSKRAVTLTSATASKTYDGTALTAKTVTPSGDGFVGSEGATYTVTGTQTNAGTSDNAFTYTLKSGTVAGNYEITTVLGTLTVEPKSLTDVTVTVVFSPAQTNFYYRGTAYTPTVVVKDGGTDVTALMDVSYDNNINVGVADVIVRPKSTSTNYKDSRTVHFNILSCEYTWDPDVPAGSWTNANNWILAGYGKGHSYPGQYANNNIYPYAKAFFTAGAFEVTTEGRISELGSELYAYIDSISTRPDTRVTFVNKTKRGFGLVCVNTKNYCHEGNITLKSTAAAEYKPGVNLDSGIPLISNELHVVDHTQLPTSSSFGFGADYALMTFTDCTFGQSNYGAADTIISINNNDNDRPVRLAITNTTWISEFAASNALGRAAIVSIDHSTNLMGMVANRLGGRFTINESLVAYNNVGTPDTDNYYGNTVYITNLTVSGASSKFALSGKCNAENGDWHFVMPAGGFANDIDVIVNNEKTPSHLIDNPAYWYYKTYFLNNLDVSYAGVAPVAVSNDLNLADATLSVDASALPAVSTNYPLVRVGSGTLTAPAASAMTVSGVPSGYVGEVRKTADGKGLDLVITVPIGNADWTWDASKVNFWYTGKSGTYPLVSGTYGGVPLVLGVDYTNVIVSASKTYTTNSVLPVGTYTNRVIGIGAYSGTNDVVIGFEVKRQKLTWTNASGPEAVGNWATGLWEKLEGTNMGNDDDRKTVPTEIVDVTLAPDGKVAWIGLGTEAAPSVSRALRMAQGATAWLHDGYLKAMDEFGAWQSDATMGFSNVTFVAGGKNPTVYGKNATLRFAGNNSLGAVTPIFYSVGNNKRMCFENGATTMDVGIVFYNDAMNSSVIDIDNARLNMAKFAPRSDTTGNITFNFKLGDLNLPLGPAMLSANAFSLGTAGTSANRFATIDATAKTGPATYDIMTIPTSFDLYAPTNAAFSPAQLTANTTCAAGLVPQIVAVTNDTMQTIQLVIKRDIAAYTATVQSPEAVEYTGSELSIKFDVKGTFGGTEVTLTEGTDYEVTFTNKVGREESSTTYVATITGKGDCVGTLEAEYTILGRVFVWAGGDSTDNRWNDATKWNRVGSGTGHGWPGDDNTLGAWALYDIPTFPAGAAYVDVNMTGYRANVVKVKEFVFDPAAVVTVEQKNVTGVNAESNSVLRGTLREIRSYNGGRSYPLFLGGKKEYLAYPVIENTLQMEALTGCPWDSAVWFGGTTGPTLSATGCEIKQDTYGTEFITFYCEDDTLPVKIAMTNTIWQTTCGSKDANMVGRNVTWTYCNSTNLTGIIANHFGGALTLDNSVVGFQNLHGTVAAANHHLPGSDAEGDTFYATGLAFSGANTKFALSENATVSGAVTFTMPAGGFANNAGVLNFHKDGKVDFNIDTTFAGVAPLAVATNLNLSAATLSVDATAVGSTPGAYPLVRVGADGTLTAPTAAMTVSGVGTGYFGSVEPTADGKGLDLVIRTKVDKPVAVTGLVYTGSEQTGVAAATGYTVTDGTATDVGSYTATATLDAGYCWTDDGSTNQYEVAWSIAKATNTWATEPVITPASWVQGVGPTTVTAATATFGADTMTITCNGATVTGDLTTYLKGLTLGSFEVVYTVPGTDNYSALSKSITVTVTLDTYYDMLTGCRWDNPSSWYADVGRTVAKGAFPTNSFLADVYVGKADAGTYTIKCNNYEYQLGYLTMAGGDVTCAFGNLRFPATGTDSRIVVQQGTFHLCGMDIYGAGYIAVSNGATIALNASSTHAEGEAHIGIDESTLSAGQTATLAVYPHDHAEGSNPTNALGYLTTGAASTTNRVVVSNAVLQLTSTTVTSGGAGKLAFDFTFGANNLPLSVANCPLQVAGTLSIASGSTLTVDATALTQSGTYPLITADTLTGAGVDLMLVQAKVKCAPNREAVVWREAGSNVVYLDILAPVCIYDFNAANPLRATLGTDAYIATNRFDATLKAPRGPSGGSIRVPGLATCRMEEVGGESGFKVQWGEHLCLPVPRQQLRDRHMKIYMRLRLTVQHASNYHSLFYWNPAVNEDGWMFVWSSSSYFGNYGGAMINKAKTESLFENGTHYTNPNPFTYDTWHDLEFLQTVNGSMLRKNGTVMISTANRNMTQTFTGTADPKTGRTPGPHKYNFFGGFADYKIASDDVLRIGCDDNGEDEPLWLSQIVIYGIDGESVPTDVQKTAETAGGDYDWSTVATDNYQNEVIFAPEAAQTWTGSESASKLLRVRFNGGTATFNDLKLDYKAKIDHEIWTLEDGSHVTLNDTTFTYDETDSETGVGYLDVCGSSSLMVTGDFAGANRTGIRFPEVGSGAGSVAFVDMTADTMAELIGGKAGVTQTLALTNAVVAFAKAATTNGVAGKLAITVKLGANNTTDNTVMTFAGALKINAGSTLKVDATGVTTPGVYPLIAAGEWLDASAETLVSSAKVSVPSGWTYVVRTVDNRVELVLMSNVFTWIGEDGGSWTNQINWIREGAEAPSYGFPSSAQHIAKFTNGTYRVITEAVSNTCYTIKEIMIDDPDTQMRFVNKTYADIGVIRVQKSDATYNGVITLESTESAWGWNSGHKGDPLLEWGYFTSGVWLGKGVPKILNELHVLNHRYKYPADSSIGFGADNALMTFTGCSFNQGYWTGPAVSLCNTNDISWRTRLAITNTSWYSEFAAPNSLGTNAVVSIAQHSNIRMGMNADAFGGSFTIDDSLAAFNNSMPSEHGDTVNLTGLTVLGESAKFVLSGNATLTGPLTFTMPALGFTNDLASVSNGQGRTNTKFGTAVTNLNIAFAGVAPVAIMKDLDLSAATLAVDATAVATAVGRYPLVRANGTLTALPATPTVTGVTGAYVGLVEASADGKGYDLIIANTITKPEPNTPLYYTGYEQAGVTNGTGYAVTDGAKTQPDTYTAKVTLLEGYRWGDAPSDTNVLEIAWTILNKYKVTCDGFEVVVDKPWTDVALTGVDPRQEPVQEKLNAHNNVHNLIKYWEVYVIGFTAEKATTVAPVVQPVQTTDATKLRLNLGTDWPAKSAQPSDSGVTVTYELHNAQTVGDTFNAVQKSIEGPQFDIPLSDWTSNVQYYRIRSVFENK